MLGKKKKKNALIVAQGKHFIHFECVAHIKAEREISTELTGWDVVRREKDLHSTFIINVSSKAEFGNLGLDPSHLSFVLSSTGSGKKVNVDVTTLPLVEFVICKVVKNIYFIVDGQS